MVMEIDWDKLTNDKMAGVENDNNSGADDAGAGASNDGGEGGVVTSPAGGSDGAADKPAGDDKPVEKTDEEKAEEQRVADEAEAEKAKGETPEQTEERHKKETEDAATEAKKKADDEAAAAADQQPSNVTVDDIKKVLEDRDQQVKFDAQRFTDISSEVEKELYPNGFDTTLKDEQGHVIATAADYKQYIDPNATTEDAERIIMNEQARLNGEVQKAKNFILEKAEIKHTMENEAVKVFNKYRDYFLKNPDMQAKIAENYRKTLTVQGATIMNAPMGLEDFYDFAMKPYVDAQSAASVAPVAPVAPKPKEQVKDERLDLMGSPSGQDDGLTKSDGSPNWDKITKDKMKG